MQFRIVIVAATLPLLLLLSVAVSVLIYSSNQVGLQIFVLFLLLASIAWLLAPQLLSRIREKGERTSQPSTASWATISGNLWATLVEQGPNKGPEKFEAFVATLFQSSGFEVIRNPPGGADDPSKGFDLIAEKDNIALVIEVKDRVATTPDLTSFLGNLRSSHLESLVGTRTVVPVLVARGYTESVRSLASREKVELLGVNSDQKLGELASAKSPLK